MRILETFFRATLKLSDQQENSAEMRTLGCHHQKVDLRGKSRQKLTFK